MPRKTTLSLSKLNVFARILFTTVKRMGLLKLMGVLMGVLMGKLMEQLNFGSVGMGGEVEGVGE